MPGRKPVGKHILVVDDTEEVLELFRDIIEDLGHRATVTTFAPEDLAEVIKISPELVILDMTIGGDAAGWQLAQKLRMSHETEKIPVIICTADTVALHDQEESLAALGMSVVLKPFSIGDLEDAINRAFAHLTLVSQAG